MNTEEKKMSCEGCEKCKDAQNAMTDEEKKVFEMRKNIDVYNRTVIESLAMRCLGKKNNHPMAKIANFAMQTVKEVVEKAINENKDNVYCDDVMYKPYFKKYNMKGEYLGEVEATQEQINEILDSKICPLMEN